jgi:hypothetical protein
MEPSLIAKQAPKSRTSTTVIGCSYLIYDRTLVDRLPPTSRWTCSAPEVGGGGSTKASHTQAARRNQLAAAFVSNSLTLEA